MTVRRRRSPGCQLSRWNSDHAEAALRDAWYLRRAGDDPGPAGRLLQVWRRLGERDPLDKAIRLALRPKEWMIDLTNALDVPLDAALEDVGDTAKKLAVGEGGAIATAAEVAAISLQKRPDAEVLAFWMLCSPTDSNGRPRCR
jgi:hypothetical protein